MAYEFYIGTMLLPVPPGKLTVKVGNNNKTYTLMNEGEVNVLKTPGLTEIEFEALLPNSKYPFSMYKDGFQAADVYLEKLEHLKAKKKTFQFIVIRALPSGSVLFDTNMTCSLEEYSIKEDADSQGTDIVVTVKLKQYRDYGVKKCKVKTKKTLNLKKLRNKKKFNLPESDDHIVWITQMQDGTPTAQIKIKKVITLYNLAKKIYGDGSLYTIIAEANYKGKRNATEAEKKKGMWKKSKKLKKGAKVMIPLEYYS